VIITGKIAITPFSAEYPGKVTVAGRKAERRRPPVHDRVHHLGHILQHLKVQHWAVKLPVYDRRKPTE